MISNEAKNICKNGAAEEIMMRYKQLDIYDALGIIQGAAVNKPSAPIPAPAPAELVGGTQAQRCKSAGKPIFYVSEYPENCFVCPCSRCWETQKGRMIACRISGEKDLAAKEGKNGRRKDCPLRILSDAAGGQGGQLR